MHAETVEILLKDGLTFLYFQQYFIWFSLLWLNGVDEWVVVALLKSEQYFSNT
jgi:hypothetical protein